MKFTLVLLAALCTVTSVEAALSPKCKAWKQRINTFINKMDTNHDNKVTYKEYVTLLSWLVSILLMNVLILCFQALHLGERAASTEVTVQRAARRTSVNF